MNVITYEGKQYRDSVDMVLTLLKDAELEAERRHDFPVFQQASWRGVYLLQVLTR